jgi:hypothetical protein
LKSAFKTSKKFIQESEVRTIALRKIGVQSETKTKIQKGKKKKKKRKEGEVARVLYMLIVDT